MPIGFGGALFLVFLVLKLTDYIGWSWWWVTAPLWIGAALTVALLLLFGAGFAAVKATGRAFR
jgi:hypothetical protein